MAATSAWVSRYLDRGYNVVPPDSTAILDAAPSGQAAIPGGARTRQRLPQLETKTACAQPQSTLL